MSKSKKAGSSSTLKQSQALERLEVSVNQEVLTAAFREAAVWGMSLDEFVQASISGSVQISREEKELFSTMRGLLRRIGRLLMTVSADSLASRPEDAQR